MRIREALLLLFCDPIPKECLLLWLLTHAEWQQALRWLDVSGLALYFLDRLEQENLCELVPESVLACLRRNLADNRVRTAALLEESSAIHHAFQDVGLSYAALKGFSLGSFSVPRLELRSQLDLDFLVANSSAAKARRILEERGYRLRGKNGRSLEFSANDAQPMSLRDLYKNTPHRYVELHIEPAASPLLVRVEMRRLHGLLVPVLHPVDLFLGQGLHVYKHLCGQFTRVAHVLEFRRHILARKNDDAFWRELHARAQSDPRHPVGLGVVTLLIAHLMGDFAPPALTHWTSEPLSLSFRLWVETCGHRAAFADSPGTKLYLLLHEALASAHISPKPSTLQVLLPHRLPPATIIVPPRGTIALTLRRRLNRGLFLVRRSRFHLVEGLRYLVEARRFRKRLSRISKDNPISHLQIPHDLTKQ